MKNKTSISAPKKVTVTAATDDELVQQLRKKANSLEEKKYNAELKEQTRRFGEKYLGNIYKHTTADYEGNRIIKWLTPVSLHGVYLDSSQTWNCQVKCRVIAYNRKVNSVHCFEETTYEWQLAKKAPKQDKDLPNAYALMKSYFGT